jgi:hypothetical protein
MRFKITGQHRRVFETQKYITFENVLPSNLIHEAALQADAILSQRFHRLIETASPSELFKIGRDLWRQDDTAKRLVQNRVLAQIAGGLFGHKTLQLAYDQLLRTPIQSAFPGATTLSLQEISCFQPLAGAALVRLLGTSLASPLFPTKSEDVVFLAPDLPIPWEVFFQEPHHSFLLIVYAPFKALYILEKRDLHTHAMKKLGYVFGDTIHPPEHPIVYTV